MRDFATVMYRVAVLSMLTILVSDTVGADPSGNAIIGMQIASVAVVLWFISIAISVVKEVRNDGD